MNDMLAITATDMRKNWSEVFDSVIRRRPAFVKRVRDRVVVSSVETMATMLTDVKYEAQQFAEDDGSVTLSLNAIDLIVNAPDINAAKEAMIAEIIEYAEEYYANFELYSRAPNRKKHLVYVMKALTAESPKELEDALVCRDGKN